MSSPTQRSLKQLRKDGWTTQVVEHWIPYTRNRKDLFGCIDLVAIRKGETLGVQATSTSNVSARLSKSLALPELVIWLEAGNRFEIWGWSKKGKAGTRKTYQLRRIIVFLKNGTLEHRER